MLDIRFIRENSDLVQKNAKDKGYDIDVIQIVDLDNDRRSIQQQVEGLREKRNTNAAHLKGGQPDQEVIDEGKRIKTELTDKEQELNIISEQLNKLLSNVPNTMLPDVPIGEQEDGVEVKLWGQPKESAIDHLDLATKRDWVDFERGAKVAGAKFYYLKGDLVLLENAITQFALDFITKKDFTLLSVPHLVNSRVARGAGFAPKSSKESNEYFIEGEDLMLIGTSEVPLTGYHADEILDESNFPLLYASLSPCYRKEAGAYGQHSRGLFRVHQFNKLEMYAFTLPETSSDMHERILAIEEELWQALEIPYRVINIASKDLGAPAAKKYDIEYWSPVDQAYRELTSCSNCTDFQARSLNIRVRRQDGSLVTPHTLNGTVVSLARTLVAVIENYQTAEGDLRIPDALKRYTGLSEKI